VGLYRIAFTHGRAGNRRAAHPQLGSHFMKCPYCAEDIKDEAIVCKHCTRDLVMVKPLLDRIEALSERLEKVEKDIKRGVRASDGADALPRPLATAVSAVAAIDRKVPILSPFAALALTFIILVAAHFLIIVHFDLSLIYLRLVSIIVPVIFGFLYRNPLGGSLPADFATGVMLAIVSILAMSAIVAQVDDVPLLPADAQGWREFAEYGASIAFGFFTGVLARNGLAALRSATLRSNKLITLISAFIASKMGGAEESEEGAAIENRLKTVESLISSIMAIGSAALSVITGLYQFMQ
jgi:hypothetical protein